eukprot:1161047-Pelagomonas_calceolata.AAC.34
MGYSGSHSTLSGQNALNDRSHTARAHTHARTHLGQDAFQDLADSLDLVDRWQWHQELEVAAAELQGRVHLYKHGKGVAGDSSTSNAHEQKHEPCCSARELECKAPD